MIIHIFKVFKAKANSNVFDNIIQQMTKKVNIIYTGRYKKIVNPTNQGFTILCNAYFLYPAVNRLIYNRAYSVGNFF